METPAIVSLQTAPEHGMVGGTWFEKMCKKCVGTTITDLHWRLRCVLVKTDQN
jgi:hypothetical protein